MKIEVFEKPNFTFPIIFPINWVLPKTKFSSLYKIYKFMEKLGLSEIMIKENLDDKEISYKMKIGELEQI